ncbi:unnamed protein product [Ambrosiozyma monospora]|uniref:Unnamed protein product n=1 Tax=Ambrosiozyma monospora TaxID=43982 RepID=A0ACB5T8Y6_AMBMO|nr:unnamed protein product [Ambrosiozyma monospora]
MTNQHDSDVSFPVIQKIIDLTTAPGSSFKHFAQLSNLLEFISDNGISHNFKVPSTFNVQPLSVKTIESEFSMKLQPLASHDPSEEIFKRINTLLKEKSIDILLSTGNSDLIIENSSFFLNMDAEYLSMNKRLDFQNIQSYLVYKNYDSSIVDQYDYFARKLQNIMNYDKVPASSASDSNVDRSNISGGNDGNSGTGEQVVMDEAEVTAYFNCRWYLVYVLFLNNEYSHVVKEFQNLVDAPAIDSISAISVLNNHYSNAFVVKEYLLRCVIISILINEHITDLPNFNKIETIKSALNSDPLLNKLLKSYTNCQYELMNQILAEIQNEFAFDFQLSKISANFVKIINYKALFSYLSFIKICPIAHIAKRFGTDEKSMKKELIKTSLIFDLNVSIDEQASTISVVDSDNFELPDKLSKLNRDLIIESKAMKINSLAKDL